MNTDYVLYGVSALAFYAIAQNLTILGLCRGAKVFAVLSIICAALGLYVTVEWCHYNTFEMVHEREKRIEAVRKELEEQRRKILTPTP